MERVHPLTKYRKEQSPPLTTAGLAKLLNLSRSYVGRIESGERNIGQDALPKIAKRTGIPAKVLRPDLAKSLEGAE